LTCIKCKSHVGIFILSSTEEERPFREKNLFFPWQLRRIELETTEEYEFDKERKESLIQDVGKEINFLYKDLK
jgi:hypothetical protein